MALNTTPKLESITEVDQPIIDWSNGTFDLKEALYLIQNFGNKSSEDWDSSQQPFFSGNIEDKNANNVDWKMVATNAILEKLPSIPRELRYIYQVLGNPSVEFYFKFWNLFSLNKIVERFAVYKENNQNNIVDFAIKNCGMGHCVICAYDVRDNKIFYRHDGGSSGWDREYYWKFIKDYIPNSTDKRDFTHWLNEIQYVYEKGPVEAFERLPLVNS